DIGVIIAPRKIADPLESPFDLGQPAAKDKEIHLPADIIKGVLKGLWQEVRPLICDQPDDKCDQRLIHIEVIPGAKDLFILVLAFLYRSQTIMVLEIPVGSRVPDNSIDPIEDAAALAPLIFQQVFETRCGISHFFQVSGAYRRYLPGATDTAG